MFKYTPVFVPCNVFVIGAGGTGSRLIPLLAQFLRTITRGKGENGWVENPTIWLVDDDTVEEKNLKRQNFIRSDVNKPKAVVLAERYQRAFETRIIPITCKVDTGGDNQFTNVVSETLSAMNRGGGEVGVNELFASSMVIMCVDSVKARRHILNTFCVNSAYRSNTFFIDAGNEDDFGQVNFFSNHIIVDNGQYAALPEKDKLPKNIMHSHDVRYIPMDYDYYRNLKDTKSTASCADLNQTLAINNVMAANIMMIVQNYYYRNTMTYNCVRIDMKGGNMTEFNDFQNFKNKAIDINLFRTLQRYGEQVEEADGTSTHMSFLNSTTEVDLTTNVYGPLRKKVREAEIAEKQLEVKMKLAQEAAAKAKEVETVRGDEEDKPSVTLGELPGLPTTARTEGSVPDNGRLYFNGIRPNPETPETIMRQEILDQLLVLNRPLNHVNFEVSVVPAVANLGIPPAPPTPGVATLPPLEIIPRVRNVVDLAPISERAI